MTFSQARVSQKGQEPQKLLKCVTLCLFSSQLNPRGGNEFDARGRHFGTKCADYASLWAKNALIGYYQPLLLQLANVGMIAQLDRVV